MALAQLLGDVVKAAGVGLAFFLLPVEAAHQSRHGLIHALIARVERRSAASRRAAMTSIEALMRCRLSSLVVS